MTTQSAIKIRIPQRYGSGRRSKAAEAAYQQGLKDFAADLRATQAGLDFHMSTRGWCYVMEQHGLAKGDFDWAQDQITACRLNGYLRPGFIEDEEGHQVVERYDYDTAPEEYYKERAREYKNAEGTFRDSWQHYRYVPFWRPQDYYIQILVEKVDLMALFAGICEKYRINMANMRGWGSLEQWAAMAAAFEEYEERGKRPVLLTCGDFDPAGLCISETIHERFERYSLFTGWDPENLVVERIGLNFDFIQAHGLSWINNLISGQGKDMTDPKGKVWRDNMYDIHGYVKKYGKRKCEANAVVVQPALGRKMLTDAIDRYLGADAYENWWDEIKDGQEAVKDLIKAAGR